MIIKSRKCSFLCEFLLNLNNTERELNMYKSFVQVDSS